MGGNSLPFINRKEKEKMKITEVIERYLSFIKREHSIGNYKFYKNHLGHFKTWTEKRDIYITEDIKYYVFDDYIADMKNTCANITINKRIGALKRMFRHMKIDYPYLQEIGKLKERVHTYDMIEEEDLRRIRSYIKSLPSCEGNNLFYQALILLLMDTGARISEILNIKKENVNIQEQEILLTETKTKVDRTVFFKGATVLAIKKMLEIKTNHEYLLHHLPLNRRPNYFDVDNYMRKLRKIMGLKKLHAHMFRHSLATIWLQSGADIVTVMNVMGHVNMETTQRYQHTKKDHMKNMFMKKFNLD